jgi:hypothetical protein
MVLDMKSLLANRSAAEFLNISPVLFSKSLAAFVEIAIL